MSSFNSYRDKEPYTNQAQEACGETPRTRSVRHLAIFRVPYANIIRFLCGDMSVVNLPADAELIGVDAVGAVRVYDLTFEHPSFAPVAEGESIRHHSFDVETRRTRDARHLGEKLARFILTL